VSAYAAHVRYFRRLSIQLHELNRATMKMEWQPLTTAFGREVESAAGGLRVVKSQWLLSSSELEGFKVGSLLSVDG
jgi:hypothetical protein